MSDIFSHLKHFKRTEHWGDPDKMSPSFLYKLDQFRDKIGLTFNVHEGYATSGHASNSMHYRGRAVDGRFLRNGQPIKLDECLYIALICPFGGIGIYSDSWAPYFHFDDREERTLWICQTKGIYEKMSLDFLRSVLS